MPEKRFIVELCCGQDSKISNNIFSDDGRCVVKRVTSKDDFRSKTCLADVLDTVERAAAIQSAMVWASFPDFTDLSAADAASFVNNFDMLCDKVTHRKGIIAIEWSKDSSSWADTSANKILDKYKLQVVSSAACSCGLKITNSKLLSYI